MTSESILVAAAYEKTDKAEDAVRDLGQAGFGQRDISVMYTDRGHVTEQGVISGALFGGLVGGLTGLFFPPLGMIIAAGPILGSLAAAISGAGLGAVTVGAVSGLGASLIQMGMPKEIAGRFGEHIHKGDTLVVVHTTRDQSAQAQEILAAHHPRTETGAQSAQSNQGAVVTPAVTPGKD